MIHNLNTIYKPSIQAIYRELLSQIYFAKLEISEVMQKSIKNYQITGIPLGVYMEIQKPPYLAALPTKILKSLLYIIYKYIHPIYNIYKYTTHNNIFNINT